MGLEQIGAADIAAQRVHGLVTGYLGHFQRIGAGLGGGGQETGAQRVTGEAGGIEAGGFGAAFEGADEAVGAERGGADGAALADRPKQGAVADRRRGEPDLQSLHGAEVGAARDGDLLTRGLRVGLGAADHDAQAVGDRGQIGDLQGEQLRATERAGEAEGDERAVAPADQGGGAGGEQSRDQVGGGRSFSRGRGAVRVADAAQHLAHRGTGGRRIEPGGAVLVGDGCGPSGDGRRSQAGLGQGSEVAAQQAGRAGQGGRAARFGPAAKIRPVTGVGAPGVGRLGRLGEAEGGGDLVRVERGIEDREAGGRDGEGCRHRVGFLRDTATRMTAGCVRGGVTMPSSRAASARKASGPLADLQGSVSASLRARAAMSSMIPPPAAPSSLLSVTASSPLGALPASSIARDNLSYHDQCLRRVAAVGGNRRSDEPICGRSA